MKQRILHLMALFVLMMSAASPAFAYSFPYYYTTVCEVDGVTYYVSFDETAGVARLDDVASQIKDTQFTIPSSFRYKDVDYPVVAFRNYAYTVDQPYVKELTLPSTLEIVGSHAFTHWKNVKTIDIPASVNTFEDYPFYGCDYMNVIMHSDTPPTCTSGLSSSGGSSHIYITVPHEHFRDYSLATHYEDACILADNWEDESDPDNPAFVKTGEVADGELGYVVVSDLLPEIRKYSDVNRLIVTKGHINADDFYQLRQMRNLVYLDLSGLDIEEIPYNALYQCWQLQTVILPKTLKRIYGNAFYETGITAIDFPESLEEVNGGYTFYRCPNLKELHFPDKILSLPSYVAYNCKNLVKLTLPAHLMTLGDNAFAFCNLCYESEDEVSLVKTKRFAPGEEGDEEDGDGDGDGDGITGDDEEDGSVVHTEEPDATIEWEGNASQIRREEIGANTSLLQLQCTGKVNHIDYIFNLQVNAPLGSDAPLAPGTYPINNTGALGTVLASAGPDGDTPYSYMEETWLVKSQTLHIGDYYLTSGLLTVEDMGDGTTKLTLDAYSQKGSHFIVHYTTKYYDGENADPYYTERILHESFNLKAQQFTAQAFTEEETLLSLIWDCPESHKHEAEDNYSRLVAVLDIYAPKDDVTGVAPGTYHINFTATPGSIQASNGSLEPLSNVIITRQHPEHEGCVGNMQFVYLTSGTLVVEKVGDDGVRMVLDATSVYGTKFHMVYGDVEEESNEPYYVIIPGSLKEIPYRAFYENKYLRVKIMDGVETIGSEAFHYDYIGTITMPPSMRTINDNAFAVCQISELNLNEGLETINTFAFRNNSLLTEVTLPSSLIYCLNYPFTDCDQLTTLTSKALIPPTVKNSVPTYYARDIKLRVPIWSFQEYMTTPGWLEYQDYIEIMEDELPENIYVNKDFEFVLRQSQLDKNPTYRPNLRMMWNTENIDDGFGHVKTERGNLTISTSSGKMRLSSFSTYFSPYAKYYSDYSRFYYNWDYDYDYQRTKYNGNALVVKGSMTADQQTINLMLMNDLWQFVTFPFDVNVCDIVPEDPGTQWVIRTYDGQARANRDFDNAWVGLTESDKLEAGRGYVMKCYNSSNTGYYSDPVLFTVKPVDHNITGQRLFTSVDQDVDLYKYENESEATLQQNYSWNLIGNQYPCFYDTRWLDTYGVFLVWDSYNKTYAAFDPEMDKYVLSPGEAFFMQRPIDPNDPAEQGTLTFREQGRQTYRNPDDLKTSVNIRRRAREVGKTRQMFNLNLTDGRLTDRTRVVFNEQATLKYEAGKDAPKFMSDNFQTPQIWTMGGSTEYSINERPMGDGTVNLGLRVNATGLYTISKGDVNTDARLFILDKQTGTTAELTDEKGYEFHAEAGTNTNRLVLMVKAADEADAIRNIDSLQAEGESYDLSGKKATQNQKGVIIKNGVKVMK